MFRLLVLVSCVYASNAASVGEHGKTRIIGGESVPIQIAPYQVSIIDDRIGSHVCGGSIISENYVLTAGHCTDLPARNYRIRAGSSYTTSGGSLHRVTKVIPHEKFRLDWIGIPMEDIALMKVSPPFKLNGRTIDTVELFEQDEKVEIGADALLTGWGVTSSGRLARELQALSLEIMPGRTCDKNYSDIGGIHEKQICAKFPTGDRDMCEGDSGGPLVIRGKQVGVVSWSGPGCAKRNRPGVYTAVAAYRDWIDRHIRY